MLKIYNNKIYSVGQEQIYLRGLRLKSVEVAKNDILKSTGTGIFLGDVFSGAPAIDPTRVIIRNNAITEITHGHAIYIENSSCLLEQNQVMKIG
jgi:hypothetical protein